MLALNQMSPGASAIFFLIAVVCFIVAAVESASSRWPKVGFIGAGLAAAFFVFAWNAVAAA